MTALPEMLYEENVSVVVLRKDELLFAALVGLRRAISKIGTSENNYVGNKDYGWATDIESACAEMAFAKDQGLYWDGSVGTYGKPDVASFQVRHTEREDGKLILRPNKTKPNEDYVLVTGAWGRYRVRGWIRGGDGMTDQFKFKGYNGMPDCWMVPQKSLNPL